jgi:hypothetical protein
MHLGNIAGYIYIYIYIYIGVFRDLSLSDTQLE